MNFIVKYIKKLFKSNFKPSEEDVYLLKNGRVRDIDTEKPKIKNQKQRKPIVKSNPKLFEEIYDEAKLKTETEDFEKGIVNFNELDNYALLLAQRSKFKISFLRFLAHEYNWTNIHKYKNPKYNFTSTKYDDANMLHYIRMLFMVGLFRSLLATDFRLSNKDIIQFLESRNYRYLPIPSFILLNKIGEISEDNSVNRKLIKVLNNYVDDIELHRYNIVYKDIEKISRLLIDYKYRKEKVSYFLIEDHFGREVNKLFLKSKNYNLKLISEALELIAIKRKNINIRKRINVLIEEMGTDFFLETCIKILTTASNFKNKVAYRYRNRVRQEDYFGMFNENLMIVFGLIQTLEAKDLIHKVPIKIIAVIAKRSYTLKQEIRLSKRSTKIGHLCVKILALSYGEEGKDQLKEIYDEIPYKRVRKAIDDYLVLE